MNKPEDPIYMLKENPQRNCFEISYRDVDALIKYLEEAKDYVHKLSLENSKLKNELEKKVEK